MEPRPLASSKPTAAPKPMPAVPLAAVGTTLLPLTTSWKLQVLAGRVGVEVELVPRVAWQAVVDAVYCAFESLYRMGRMLPWRPPFFSLMRVWMPACTGVATEVPPTMPALFKPPVLLVEQMELAQKSVPSWPLAEILTRSGTRRCVPSDV